jgi:hypothetical protein
MVLLKIKCCKILTQQLTEYLRVKLDSTKQYERVVYRRRVMYIQ